MYIDPLIAVLHRLTRTPWTAPDRRKTPLLRCECASSPQLSSATDSPLSPPCPRHALLLSQTPSQTPSAPSRTAQRHVSSRLHRHPQPPSSTRCTAGFLPYLLSSVSPPSLRLSPTRKRQTTPRTRTRSASLDLAAEALSFETGAEVQALPYGRVAGLRETAKARKTRIRLTTCVRTMHLSRAKKRTTPAGTRWRRSSRRTPR
jgi:hypothetical protein